MSMRIVSQTSHHGFSLELDLSLPTTGVTAVFGPSGSGKTSLLRMIAGLDKRPGAEVHFNQQCWQQENRFVSVDQRKIGYVFQQPGLFPHLNVAQNITYGQSRNAQSDDIFIQLIDELIDIFELRRLIKRDPHSLSGGEQQRVAIVRALASSPQLLLMDEPLASLDEALKSEFMGYLEQILKTLPIPVIYVTHSKQEVARLSQHLLLLKAGKCVANAKTRDIFTDFSLDVSLFDSPQALIPARVIHIDPRFQLTRFTSGLGEVVATISKHQPGQQATLVIQASDVSITLSRQTDSSIQNIFAGRITQFEKVGEGKVLLKIAIQDDVLLSQISEQSFEHLGLAINQAVFAQIKSVAIH